MACLSRNGSTPNHVPPACPRRPARATIRDDDAKHPIPLRKVRMLGDGGKA